MSGAFDKLAKLSAPTVIAHAGERRADGAYEFMIKRAPLGQMTFVVAYELEVHEDDYALAIATLHADAAHALRCRRRDEEDV